MKKLSRDLKEKLVDLILAQAGAALPGEDKMDAVIGDAAGWLDGQIKFRKLGPVGMFLEMVDGPIIRFILNITGQLVYDGLKESGRI